MKYSARVLLGIGILFAAFVATAQAQDAPVVADGKTVSFDYTLTVDGKTVDTSEGKKPLEYVHGQGKLIPGLEKQVAGMKVGEEKDIDVKAEDAYGPVDPKAVQEIQKSLIPADIKLEVGTLLEMTDDKGGIFPATIKEIKDQTVLLDFNHPLAGKDLKFHLKITDIK